MITVAAAAAGCIAGLLICWAFGRMVLIPAWRGRPPPFGIVCVVGVCVLAAAGGVLNALALAGPPALLLLAVAGMVLAVYLLLLEHRAGRLGRPRCSDLLALAPLLAYVTLLAATTLPAGVYNFEDDLHVYLVRAARMLDTGSLAGNPFDSLGVDGLGAQSFMQGFVLLFLPVTYAHAFDSLFSVLLAGLALDGLGRVWGAAWPLRLAAGSLMVVLPTQSINLSAAYAGSALLLALLYAATRLVESRREGMPDRPIVAIAVASLVAASLAAFKFTYAPFAALLLAALLLLVPRRVRLPAVLAAVVVAVVVLLPWTLLALSTHLQGMQSPWQASGTPSAHSLSWGGLPSLLDIGSELLWGGWALVFYAVFLLTGLPALMQVDQRARIDTGLRALLLPPALASGAFIATFVLFVWLVEVQNAIRYLCPLLTTLLPAALLASSLAWSVMASRSASADVARPAGRLPLVGIAVAWGFSALAFTDLFVLRVQQAVVHATPVTYPVTRQNVLAAGRVFAPATTALFRDLQVLTMPGEVLLTWTAADFRADFERNPIYAITETGMLLPWVAARATDDTKELSRTLQQLEVRYVLLQFDGIGINSVAWYEQAAAALPGPALEHIWGSMARLRSGLSGLAHDSRVLAYRPPLVLFELHRPP